MHPDELAGNGSRVWIVGGIVAVCGVFPLVIYWATLGRLPTIVPEEARQLLRQEQSTAVLIDVRTAADYADRHVDGSINWPLAAIMTVESADQLPEPFRGKTLLLICDVGFASGRATWHLERIGVPHSMNIRGGFQEWIRSVREHDASQFDRWRLGSEQVADFAFRESTTMQQAIVVAAFFGAKLVYTLLSLIVMILVWRCRSQDLIALRWAMIAFFIGENACAMNVLVFHEHSYFLEYLHSVGMTICFGLTTFAILDGIDQRILGLSAPERHCAANRLCGRCIKQADVPCGLRRMFWVVIPGCLFIALMLPTADWHDETYHTFIFGQFHTFGHPRVFQLFETWVCPGFAIILFSISLLILAFGGSNAVNWSKITFASGMGPLGFGMLRLVITSAYIHNQHWYAFWEETTELLFLLAVCLTLWTFRKQLIPHWVSRWNQWREQLSKLAETA